MPDESAHSPTAKFFNWSFIVVFIYALTKQLDEVDELEDAHLLEQEMMFASIFLVILTARFLYMQFTKPTVLPHEIPKQKRLIARSVHLAMYFMLGLIAATGLGIGMLYGADIKSGQAMEALLLLHEIGVISSYWLIAGHIAAALYHRRQADGIWDAMVPFWKENRLERRNG